ncbi:high-affinity branched-chain amino acid ABC transporter permease LivM [Bosea lathyri]|uniref:General L-amino acid ABC transporter membrane protein n=1 Tax=Bosea lathyri TaxID=1036778 RepID=A0A1H5XSN3_9HYPH|nr:high-affinity branched-chain amino acid ABC transporter permease LivM [Bosea lathyri]SEG14663.1 general L-amino acid ABC transporter membrane protein [Bosea lathyri]
MAQTSSTPNATPGPRKLDLKAALKEAGFAAFVTLGLCIPIIAWGTRQNMDNVLVLDPRWDAVAWAVGIVFVGRFLMALRQQGKADRKSLVRFLPHGTFAFFQRNSRVFSLFGLGFLVTFPIIAINLAGWGGALKWIDNFGVQILIYVMLGWGLNIVVGLAGLLDLGYVAFYAVGAYSYALLAKNFGLSFWILLPMSGILAAFWGMLLGFPVLRLRGDYLAIVTLAFGEIIRLILINWVEFSNGYAGISGIPRPSFFGIPFNASDEGFAAVFGLEFSPLYRTIFLYYLILALALLTAFVSLRLRRLPVGRAWEALREDEIACRSLGINTTNTKLTAFSIGAMFGGFAGAFFSARQGFISPESFVFMESAIILAIVVLGGMGSLWGCAIAAIVMIGGTELLRELDWLKAIFGNDFDPTKYRMLIFGFAMVVIMIWKPRGLISTREPTTFLKEKKTISADMVQEGHG